MVCDNMGIANFRVLGEKHPITANFCRFGLTPIFSSLAPLALAKNFFLGKERGGS